MRENGLRHTAFWLMAVSGVLAGLWIAAEALTEPGGAAGIMLTAAWLVPLVALAAFSLLRPQRAARVLPFVVGAVLLYVVADALFLLSPSAWGPVAGVGVFATGVVLAFLGLHRPGRAGLLMVVMVLVLVVSSIGNAALHATGILPPGPGIGGSAMLLALPVLLSGVLFQQAGGSGRRASAWRRDDLPVR